MNQSVAPYLVLTAVSGPTNKFLRKQVRWGIPISLRVFQFAVIHTVKAFSVVSEGEVGFFPPLKSPCFLYDSVYVGNLISGSSVFSKLGLYMWKFMWRRYTYFYNTFSKSEMQRFTHTLFGKWITLTLIDAKIAGKCSPTWRTTFPEPCLMRREHKVL